MMVSAVGETAPPRARRGDVVLLCAAPAERRALRGAAGPGVRVLVSGMGAGPAARAAAEVVADGPAALVAVGFCGALDPTLRVGDVVAAEAVRDAATEDRFPTDPALLAAALGRLDGTPRRGGALLDETHPPPTPRLVVRGTIVSAVRLARTPADRAALVAEAAGATAADLESAALARAAAGAGVPFLALRAVTDETHHRLPDLDRLMDAAGRLTPGAGLLYFVRRPRELPALVRLGPAARTAGAALAAAVDELLARIR